MKVSSEIVALMAAIGFGAGIFVPDWSKSVTNVGPPDVFVSFPNYTANVDQDNRIFVGGRANDLPVRFLLDTGASVTLLTAADAESLGFTGDRREAVAVRGLDGMATAYRFTISDLSIGRARMRNVDVLIMNGLEHSLLGMDVLRKIGPVELRFGSQAYSDPAG